MADNRDCGVVLKAEQKQNLLGEIIGDKIIAIGEIMTYEPLAKRPTPALPTAAAPCMGGSACSSF